MREKKIKHLPVVDKKLVVVGVLSDRDIKEYMPSKATTLDVFELHNVLLETKVAKVMRKQVFTAKPDLPIEEAMLMYDKNIGCLPIVENNKLVGIISDRDLFRGKHRGQAQLLSSPIHSFPQSRLWIKKFWNNGYCH
jgi:acetoin utilization protein AcuB